MGTAGVLRAALLGTLLAGCGANEDAIRIVEHRPEVAPPAPFRFELVETATVATGSSVEIWFPIASSEPGVQEIERLDVTIKPDVPYEIEDDVRGNRTIHARGAALVSVTYRASCYERPIEPTQMDRPGPPVPRRLFPEELAPSDDLQLAVLREHGTPARAAAGLALGGGAAPIDWIETFASGEWRGPWHQRPVLIVVHGRYEAMPSAKVDGAVGTPHVEFELRTPR